MTERLYYFAGEKVSQSITPNTTIMDETDTGDRERSTFRPSHKPRTTHTNDTTFNNSFGATPISERHERNEGSTIRKENKDPNADPKDLGIEFVDSLMEEYKRIRRMTSTDPKAYFEFWKMLKKAAVKEKALEKSSMGDTMKSGGRSSTAPRMRPGSATRSPSKGKKKSLVQYAEQDVLYTLEHRAGYLNRDQNIAKFLLNESLKLENKRPESAQKKRGMSKETMARLYHPPDPATIKKKSSATANQNAEDKEHLEFTERLIACYKEGLPEKDKGKGVNPVLLMNHWKEMYDKEEKQLNVPEDKADEHINGYFDQKLRKVDELYEVKHGYLCDTPKDLCNFYLKELKPEEKTKHGLELDEGFLDPLFETYCERKRVAKEKKAEEEKSKEHKAKLERELLLKKVLTKAITKTDLDELAKPKDKLYTGKQIMNLAKLFPKDRILKKILIQEFHEKKIAKNPEEYDVYNSEEEAEIKGRDQPKEPYKSAQAEGRKFLTLKDIEKPLLEREKEITEPFNEKLEEFYLEHNKKLEQEEEKRKNEAREDKLLERFVLNKVKEYLKLRRQRLEKKAPTVKEFLGTSYKEMESLHAQATKRRFRNVHYGVSKKTKQKNLFPVEYKRYFFELVRAMAHGNKIEQGKKLLPFWAPPSSGSTKHPLDAAVNKTYNNKVAGLSRDIQTKKVEADIEEKTCWDKDSFQEHRKLFLMKLSDAKECTFYPKTGSNIPKKYKDRILKEYPSWSNEMMEHKSVNFDNWVKKMGDNFCKRFPTIYKYGKYKRAVNLVRRNQFIAAYKELADSFNIPSMKKNYEPNYNPEKEKDSMFSRQNLKLEEKEMPQEDFDDDANRRFLDEVYSLIKFIESREKEFKKNKASYEARLEAEQRRTFVKPDMTARTEETMKKETDMVRTIMFPFKDSGDMTKYGPKTNDIAYRMIDLRFEQEVRARRKMLKTVIENLTKEFEKDNKLVAWNPGGSKSLMLKNKTLENYRKLAKKKYLKLLKNEEFNKKVATLHEKEAVMNKKMGLYRQACVYYSKQMYNQAFKTIIKAIEIVKVENEKREEERAKTATFWRQKLGIPPGTNITYETLLAPDMDDEETERTSSHQLRTKLWIFAHKTGMLGEKPQSVNDLLNYQIQKLYKDIEKVLEDKNKDLIMMKQKIEKLEDEQGDEDVDPEFVEKKIRTMTKAIETRRKIIVEGKPPVHWNPTSAQDAILPSKVWEEKQKMKELLANPVKAGRTLGKSTSRSMDRFFEQDIDDIGKIPFEREREIN